LFLIISVLLLVLVNEKVSPLFVLIVKIAMSATVCQWTYTNVNYGIVASSSSS